MACDPNTLLEQAKCLNACIPQGMQQAVGLALLCNIANGGGGEFVLKAGDTMSGKLTIDLGTQAVGPGNALSLSAIFDDGGAASENFTLLALNVDNSSGNFNESFALQITDVGGVGLSFWITPEGDATGNTLNVSSLGNGYVGFGGLTLLRSDAANQITLRNNTNAQSIVVYNTYTSSTNNEGFTLGWNLSEAFLNIFKGSVGGTLRTFDLKINGTSLLRLGSATTMSFFGATAVVKQTSGANLTNNVTAGGTDDTIADFTSLTVYATDAATIRNDIYQLARKLKQINDGLRAYGLFT